jgi:hypothetical protein
MSHILRPHKVLTLSARKPLNISDDLCDNQDTLRVKRENEEEAYCNAIKIQKERRSQHLDV